VNKKITIMYKVYLSLMVFLLVGLGACELPDNVDPKRPSDVPAEQLFSNGQLELANQVNSSDVNLNISRLLVQHWQQTTYFNEARYNFQDRGIPDGYADRFYRIALMDLNEAKLKLQEQELTGNLAVIKENKLAIIEILTVYGFQCLVDAFGDMPYTEALQGAANSTPAYDDAKTIYMDLMSRLQAAVNKLDASEGSFGSADFMFGGDIASWETFGASLMLRMGLRIADAMPSEAQSLVSGALGKGVISSNAENGALKYTGVQPHINTIYDHFFVDGRKDWVPANTLIDMMNSLDDPRRALWFTPYEGEFVGGVVGLNGAQSYPNFSNHADQMLDPGLEAMLIDYSEVQFLLAEAVERGLTTGDAAEHYTNAIRANMEYWGADEADIDAYLANPDVSYATAPGNWKQKIGTQKWIAFYNKAVEAWAEWRRLDQPTLNVPEGLSYGDIPLRMPYPYDEGELNGSNYNAAASKMGGDKVNVRVFWDTE
jgi:hypothetical protein